MILEEYEGVTPVALPFVIVGYLLDASVVVVRVPGQEPRVLLVGDQQAGGGTIGVILGGAIGSTLLISYAGPFLKREKISSSEI